MTTLEGLKGIFGSRSIDADLRPHEGAHHLADSRPLYRKRLSKRGTIISGSFVWRVKDVYPE